MASEDTCCTCEKAAEGHLGWDKSMIDPDCPLHGHEAPEKRPDAQMEALKTALAGSEDTRERKALRQIREWAEDEADDTPSGLVFSSIANEAERVLSIRGSSPVGEEREEAVVRVWIDRQHYDFKKRLTTGSKLRKAASIPDEMSLWREGRTPTDEDVEVPEDQGFALFQDDRFYSSPRLISGAAAPPVGVDEDERWLMQTKIGGGHLPPEERGDCVPACIASILGLPITAIANTHGEGWWDCLQGEVGRYGYCLAVLDMKLSPPPGYWIASVPSLNLPAEPNGKQALHCVVALGYELAHDPCLGKRYDAETWTRAFDAEEIPEGWVLAALDPAARPSSTAPGVTGDAADVYRTLDELTSAVKGYIGAVSISLAGTGTSNIGDRSAALNEALTIADAVLSYANPARAALAVSSSDPVIGAAVLRELVDGCESALRAGNPVVPTEWVHELATKALTPNCSRSVQGLGDSAVSPAPRHSIEIRTHERRLSFVHVAVCSCGWEGSEAENGAQAGREGDAHLAAVSPAPTEGPTRRDGLSLAQVEKLKALGWCGCNTACALLPVEQARTGRKCRYVAGEVKPISKLNKAASDLVDAAAPTEGPDDA